MERGVRAIEVRKRAKKPERERERRGLAGERHLLYRLFSGFQGRGEFRISASVLIGLHGTGREVKLGLTSLADLGLE